METMNIIDSDRHVVETNAIWKDYLPEKMHQYIPYFDVPATVDSEEGISENLLPSYMIAGKPLLKQWNENRRIQIEAAKQSKNCVAELSMATSPALQLKTMDEAGIQGAYLFPTYATFIINSENILPEVSLAFAGAYNRWLRDYCKEGQGRLNGVGMVSRHDPKTMVKQLQEIIKLGFKVVVVRPEMLFGRMLGHEDYDSFWNECHQNRISVAIHGGTHLHASTIGTDRFKKHFSLHACSHPMEAQTAFLSLLESGVLERYPALKFAFLEAGASWVPHWLWRLDEICYTTMPGEVADTVKMKPSEYFKRQCWVGFEVEEPCLREVVNMVGIDRLLFGSDFPHPDHLHFNIDGIESKCPFSREEIKTIFQDNPRGFFS